MVCANSLLASSEIEPHFKEVIEGVLWSNFFSSCITRAALLSTCWSTQNCFDPDVPAAAKALLILERVGKKQVVWAKTRLCVWKINDDVCK